MKRILFTLTAVVSLGLSACGDYLDINTHPNSPSKENVDAAILISGVEMTLAVSYGDFLRITGGFYAQHYAHLNGTSNYLDYSRFSMSPVRSSGTYTQLNQKGLNDIKTILEKSEALGDWGTALAATTLRAFIYQALVDCYGEVPYSEAMNPDIPQPKYDSGQTIYEGLIAEIDAAMEKVTPTTTVVKSMLFPSAVNAAQWIQFANALKLKLLMRMADVSGIDIQSQISALVSANNFPTADVSYKGCWADQLGQMSPFYAEEFRPGVQYNVAANAAIIGTMLIKDDQGNVLYQDPRLAKFFDQNSDKAYVGSVSGTQYPGVTNLTKWCRPSVTFDSPVYLMTVAEVEFFKAEYHARWGSATDAAASYAAAVGASFASAGVSGVDGYLAQWPYAQDTKMKSIGIAKWVALSGVNPFEAWCEVRRLNYPAFGEATGDNFFSEGNDASFNTSKYTPGTLYTPILVFAQVGNNKLLERFPYPESSSSHNQNTPEFPGYTSPIFWGAN